MRVLFAIFLIPIVLPLFVIYNIIKMAIIMTVRQDFYRAVMLWIFLFPVMIILSIVEGLRETVKMIQEMWKNANEELNNSSP